MSKRSDRPKGGANDCTGAWLSLTAGIHGARRTRPDDVHAVNARVVPSEQIAAECGVAAWIYVDRNDFPAGRLESSANGMSS